MKRISFLICICLLSISVYSQIDPIDKNGLAVGGYDLVAYFESGKAIVGTQQNSISINGTKYLFSTQQNQKLFESEPLKYLPQYEGYCALAVSYGKKISVDPKTFKVTDGKLYLFYNGNASGKKVNSLETWNKNEERLLKKADNLWPDVKKKKYKSGDTF